MSATELVDRLMALWMRPFNDQAEAGRRFAELYHDPIVINGTVMRRSALVDLAAAAHLALRRDKIEILDVVAAPNRIAVAFRIVGTQVGTYRSALGDFPSRGATFQLQVIDILGLRDGKIETIWMVADEAGLLAQLDAAEDLSGSASP